MMAVIVPGERAGCCVELACKGPEGLELRPRVQSAQHGGTGDMIESADRIDGKHGSSRARLSGGAEEPTHGFSPCAGAEPKLVRHARLLQVWGEVLREHPTNQPSQHVANDECANPAVGLCEGDKAPDPDALEHIGGHVCIG